MPQFKYKARSRRGDVLEGLIEGTASDAVAAQLVHSGVTPVEIREVESEARKGPGWAARLLERPPSLAELILFSRQMYTLVKAGVPLIRGMRTLAGSARNPAFAAVVTDIGERLESGLELAAALRRHPTVFPSLMVNLVRVGEESGRLDASFERIAAYLELEKEIRDQVKSALRYPLIVILAIAIATGIINVFVIPAFAEVFVRAEVPLPWQTRLLIDISEFFVGYWPYMLGGLFAAIVGGRCYVGTEMGRYRWDKLQLRLPLVGGIIHRATLARFTRAFSLASRSGVPLIQGLTVSARAVGNEFVAERILQMRDGVERGEPLVSTAASTHLFTPLVLQMIAVGEETGAVDELLEEVAGFYEREIEQDLGSLASAIEPLLIVSIGIMVLILALGVFLPLWDLSTTLRS